MRAALAARRNADTFVLARTDGRCAEGVADTIKRAGMRGQRGVRRRLRSVAGLNRVGKSLSGTPLATTMMEGGGRLDWVPPAEIHGYGFQMILYPTTVLFQMARATEQALAGLKGGKPMAAGNSVTLDAFEGIVGMPGWQEIERQFGNG